jgi:hypothetical protein
MKNHFGRWLDATLQILRLQHPGSKLLPLAPVRWDPAARPSFSQATTDQLAVRLHSLRAEISVEDFRKQVQNPIASRGIAIWVKVKLPQLRRDMVLDTRVDNPAGLPASLRGLPDSGPGSPWPQPPSGTPGTRLQRVVPLGHGGSSCPGYLSKFAVFSHNDAMEIPVEVLAFHVEGQNESCAYSVSMYSEVTGRLTASARASDPAILTMWGKMLISFRAFNASEFNGRAARCHLRFSAAHSRRVSRV